MDIGFLLVVFLFISLSFGALYVIVSNGMNWIWSLTEVTPNTNEKVQTETKSIPNTSDYTEQDTTIDGDFNTILSDESTILYDTIKDFLTIDPTKPLLLISAIIYIAHIIVFFLFHQRYKYIQLWRNSKQKKKQELLKKENSGYNAYLVSIQISKKLDYLVTSDGKPPPFSNTDEIFYKNNETFEQIQKMLTAIQAVYTTFMRENNLKMNGYEANFKSVLKTIEKSEMISMLDNHKVLEGIFGTINYIHCDMVGSLEENLTKDLRREYGITRTIKDRHKKNA